MFCGLFHAAPRFVIHAEIAFWRLARSRAPAAPSGFFWCFHAIIIWAPKIKATLYLVGVQI